MELCIVCRNSTEFHRFQCGHFYCANCIISSYYNILLSFRECILNFREIFQGKYSYFACLKNCEKSKLSLSVRDIEKLLDKADRFEQKEEFLEILGIGKFFFTGVPSNFFECFKCKKVFSGIFVDSVMCEDCLINICLETVGLRPRSVIVNRYFTTSKEFHEKDDYFENNFFLVRYDLTENTYICREVYENGYQVPVLQESEGEIECYLIRAKVYCPYDDSIIINNPKTDLQAVCFIRIYFES